MAVSRRRSGRRHDPGTLFGADDHARHHHGLFCADHGHSKRLRQLLSAHSNRRGRHGLPDPQYAFFLADAPGVFDARRCHDRRRRRTNFRMDRLSSAERGRGSRRPRAGDGAGSLDRGYRFLLPGVGAWRAQLHRNDDQSAGGGNEHDAASTDCLGLVCNRRHGARRFRGSAGGRDLAAAGPCGLNGLLHSRGNDRQRPHHRTGRRLAHLVAALAMVFRTPGGLHHHRPRTGRDLSHSRRHVAQAGVLLPGRGDLHRDHFDAGVLCLGTPLCS